MLKRLFPNLIAMSALDAAMLVFGMVWLIAAVSALFMPDPQ